MLYPRLLAGDFEKLPRALRLFHGAPGGGRASGTATVRRTSGWLAGLMGFPQPGDGIPLQLRVVASEEREVWIRSFNGAELRTVQRCDGDLLVESAGPLRLTFRILADETGVRFRLLRARFWIFPVPLSIDAHEWGDDTRWEFQVTVAWVGSYRGIMVPTSTAVPTNTAVPTI